MHAMLDDLLDDAFNRLTQGDAAGAEACYRRALEVDGESYEAVYGLGLALLQQDKASESLPYLNRASQNNQADDECVCNYALALLKSGDHAGAQEAYSRALQMQKTPVAMIGLGKAWLAGGQYVQANSIAATLLNEIPPGHALAEQVAWVVRQLGVHFEQEGHYARAMELFHAATQYAPREAAYWVDLARMDRLANRHEDALEAIGKAESLGDAGVLYWMEKARCLQQIGDLQGSLDCLHQALSRKQDLSQAPRMLANLQREVAVKMLYADGFSPQEVADQHRRAGQAYADALGQATIQPRARQRDAQRLRIGYVSPDFKQHVVARFLLPVFTHHDRHRFSIHAYALSPANDGFTQRLRELSDQWRPCHNLTHQSLAEVMVEDGIDILVDLMGYTHDAVGTFAWRCAPVQVTYLGYPATTGLAAMDYRITDAKADPPGMTEPLHTEKLVRLPESAWCIHFDVEPEIQSIREGRHGRVVFGCFNGTYKITPSTARLWGQILRQVPDALLLLKGMNLAQERTRQRLRRFLIEAGVDGDRVVILPTTPTYEQHLSCYNQVDIALDTFPYHGTTTTCEALFMGVPVVSLAGRAHVSRVGASLLETVGLGDLVAQSPEEYVAKAVALANDRDRLVHLRQTLRETMKKSILMDGPRFTRQLEEAYLRMWDEKVGSIKYMS